VPREAVELVGEPVAGDRTLDQTAEALSGVLVPSSPQMETIFTGRSSVVESNGKSRAYTRFEASHDSTDRLEHGAGAGAFAAAVLRHPQAFLPPESLHLLVVHCPPLRAGVPERVANPRRGYSRAHSRSQVRKAASGSAGVVDGGGRRWVDRC
jgi:hypothetical protein